MKQAIFNILVLIGLGVIIYLLFQEKPKPPTITNTTVIDSATSHTTVHNPTVYIRESVPLTIPAQIDTAKILQAYFTSHFYTQTLRDTTAEIEATISDSVAFNRLVWRNIQLKNLRATTITKTVFDTCPELPKPKKFNLYVGGRFGFTPITKQVSQITPVIGVKLGKMQLDYGYNLAGKEHQLGVSRVIR